MINLPDVEAMRAFGVELAAYLRAGDVLLLDGALGAGKTTLSQATIGALAVNDESVASPTFTLVQRYPVRFANGQESQCLHADLYRLQHPDELEEVGLAEAFGESLCIVEWPSRLGQYVPQTYIYCGIETDNASQGRQVTLRIEGVKPHHHALQAWYENYQTG